MTTTPTWIEKLALEQLRPKALAGASDAEVGEAWLRLNQWYSSARRRGAAVEAFVNAAVFVLADLRRRRVNINADLDLVRAADELAGVKKDARVAERLAELPRDLVVVREFVSLVGSATKGDDGAEPGDVDVVFRAPRDESGECFMIQAENAWLPIRKVFDPEKTGLPLHFIDNPQGAHADYVPVYDLVLRRREAFDKVVVKEGGGAAAVAKTLPNGVAEVGIHLHNLEREAARTKADGAHAHLYVLPDGSRVWSSEDGEHAHALADEFADDAVGGAHRHRVVLPDGTELWTAVDGAHVHQLQVWSTAFDGAHGHALTLADGTVVRNLSPGAFWALEGQQTPAGVAAAPAASELAGGGGECVEMVGDGAVAKADGVEEQFAADEPAAVHDGAVDDPPAEQRVTAADAGFGGGDVDLTLAAFGLALAKGADGAADDEGGETRSERAEEHWRKAWGTMLPPSGRGRFVYQHHWRGLVADDVDRDDDWLMQNSDHSVHGDLRFTGADGELWGAAVFLGRTADNRGLPVNDKLVGLKQGDALRSSLKQPQPSAWLDVGVDRPAVMKPGDVGATANASAKFFAVDRGEYEVGFAKESVVEVFLHGEHLRGRYLLQRLDRGPSPTWVLTRPTDQTPFADRLELADVAAVERGKGRRWVFWPKASPKLVEVADVAPPSGAVAKSSPLVVVVKEDAEQRIVCGVVLRPNMVDTQDDTHTEDDVVRAAHWFLEHARTLGFRHRGKIAGAVLESYVAPATFPLGNGMVRKGDWVMVVRVDDDDVWRGIKDGRYRGFSVGGLGTRQPA